MRVHYRLGGTCIIVQLVAKTKDMPFVIKTLTLIVETTACVRPDLQSRGVKNEFIVIGSHEKKDVTTT